jgi:HEAT repeat protein
MLKDPLSIPAFAEKQAKALRTSALSAEQACSIFSAAEGLLGSAARGVRPGAASGLQPKPASAGLPLIVDPPSRRAIERLARAMEDARQGVLRTIGSLGPEERAAALTEVRAIVANETSARSDPAAYDLMARFDAGPMLASSRLLCERVLEEVVPALRKTSMAPGAAEHRWTYPFGDALIVGPGERVFTEEDLKGVSLLIHLGNRSVYRGPVAAAGEGEVRVVIDLASDVTVEASTSSPSAGSGVFGIGLLFLPNDAGTKRITAGDLSMGAGLFGVGGLFIEGTGNVLQGGRFTQGAGAFGAGVLWSKGTSAVLNADQASQGYGFTRGAGVFSHRGSNGRLECGLRYPDPREASAALSLCQGVGYGPRAFAGGGAGLAMIAGNDNTLVTSYFGQGSGYWHGIGALFAAGDRNRLQARRYSQGAGIHTAIGILSVDGSSNSLVNWGVGPAFGWDYGVGYWLLNGNGNTARADWGTGRGDVNGHGLAVVRGNRNRLLLPEFGTGFYKRAAPGLGLASIEGKDNSLGLSALRSRTRVQRLALGPWGMVESRSGLILDPDLSLPQARWPALDRTAALTAERAGLIAMLEAALSKTGAERVASLLAVTSAFSLETHVPRQALLELFRLPGEDLPLLEAELSADRFDEYLWLRVLLAGFGPEVAAWAQKVYDAAGGTHKALILQCSRYGRLADALPLLARAIKDPDWRVRREAAGSIGYLFSREQGDEPGRLRSYEVLISSASREEAVRLLGWKRAPDLMAALSLGGTVTPDERGFLLHRFPGPNEPLPAESLSLLLDLLEARPERPAALKAETADAARLAGRASALLARAARDPDPDVASAALGSLGAMGRSGDAPLLASFLGRKDAKRRDAAASGLARMGPAARGAVRRALSSSDRSVKLAACRAAAQSWDPGTLTLLDRCLADRAPEVRSAGIAALSAVQGALSLEKKRFRPVLRRLADSDHSTSVRAVASFAASQIPQ